ncbi:MAG: molybdate transport repressor ModE-like protein [Halieaceae bacterium]|jgi:molybdate transport repressor ModE-like protein
MDVIDSMRVFAAVAAEGSFTRGSERAGVSVQTASKTVRALETRLGVQLFDRNTRSVSLNATGQAYLERCTDLLAEFDELESTVQRQHQTLRGRIRITAPTTFGEKYLVPALCTFIEENPDIKIDISLSDRKVALVEEGYDMALRIGQPSDSTLVARRLAPMRVVVCVSPAYIQREGEPPTPESLAERRCVIDSNFRSERVWPFSRGEETVRVAVDGPMTANTPEATRRFALAGLGVAMCPMYVVGDDIVAGRLKVLFAEQEAYHFGVYALYPHRRHLSARVRELVDHLAAAFRQL